MTTTINNHKAYDSYSFRKNTIHELKSKLIFEAACFTTVDPHTLLSTGAVTDGRIEKIHSRLFESEYLTDDYNSFIVLAKSTKPIALLSQSTEGELRRSRRYRDILLPTGFGDELRAALMYRGMCWGFLTLFRSTDQGLFSNDELKQLSYLIPSIAQSLQTFSLRPPKLIQKQSFESGILILNDSFNILSSNAAAESLLEWLRDREKVESHILPRPIRAICSQAKANAIIRNRDAEKAKLCIRMSDSTFLSIHASKLNGTTSQFAVMTEQAKPQEVVALLYETYDLSSREKQLVNQLLYGHSTKHIAETLSISVYTVQDHLKSIFMKTGVRSRRELISLLLSHYKI
ncbi:helix-turn-helix transcriptional regulator [Evansella halocellulosilytica]|uniref:helix-turn-helix transcriptional regulator n=1 Tax=Evansella halocellulosilytica TaxID=2011013 RepID=UPI000BB9A3C1|nr:helix-turn-helix transcriptional regulator [Evansella halocellulosilytica]